jgi:hypothetical protein
MDILELEYQAIAFVYVTPGRVILKCKLAQMSDASVLSMTNGVADTLERI